LACCLENSPYEDADAALAALNEQYFDWNEVRVSTVRELAEVMKTLVDPEDSAVRLKRSLQSVFESIYAFDLEPLAKENLGKATERLSRYPGTTSFVVAHVTQTALGGHAVPVNRGLLLAFHVLGVISAEELQQGTVPGLERTIPKSKGQEVGSILHQFGVFVGRNPYSPAVRKLLLEIDPDCKERLPKRPAKADGSPEPEAEDVQPAPKQAKKKTPQREAAGPPATSVEKKPPKKVAKTKTADRKKPADDDTPKKKVKTSSPTKAVAKKKTSSRQLAKSKPR
jgi:endonuclease-3